MPFPVLHAAVWLTSVMPLDCPAEYVTVGRSQEKKKYGDEDSIQYPMADGPVRPNRMAPPQHTAGMNGLYPNTPPMAAPPSSRPVTQGQARPISQGPTSARSGVTSPPPPYRNS
ncbi:hypothetical protein CYLTODRAFT_289459 [Cylindrobasidium torrendii FP15055 ss-10]|uniref:Uncharacterized protein n=1 Tax=Cylindrobasidium torrendii FP15055 ss-10 TaxID=1314674 RepID=A0A0D7BD93_9AGAR|nr:hypothetical protein CYLTODRAFT_289459 [Cylindrobasidium torrendii FP15055 ss-10]